MTGPQFRDVSFRTMSGLRLHVERYDGGAPAFVLIHGRGEGAFAWDLFAPVLARYFTTLAVDLRGHGDSGWMAPSEYNCGGYVSDVRYVVDHSDLGDFALVGHSLGGEIATHLCAHYGERIRACVLVDFAPQPSSEGSHHARSLLRESVRVYETVDQYTDWLKQTRLLAHPELLERLAVRALRRDGARLRLKLDPAVVKAFQDLDADQVHALWSLLGRQSCPTLVVRGSASAVLSPATAERVAEVLPRGELATVHAAGHAVMLDNPMGFQQAVLTFLERVLAVPHEKSA